MSIKVKAAMREIIKDGNVKCVESDLYQVRAQSLNYES